MSFLGFANKVKHGLKSNGTNSMDFEPILRRLDQKTILTITAIKIIFWSNLHNFGSKSIQSVQFDLFHFASLDSLFKIRDQERTDFFSLVFISFVKILLFVK